MVCIRGANLSCWTLLLSEVRGSTRGSRTQTYLSVMVINAGTIYHIAFGSSESSSAKIKAEYFF